MGYYSEISGYVYLTEKACERLRNAKMRCGDCEMTVEEYVDDFEHCNEELYISRTGKGYCDEQLLDLIAAVKDVDTVDFLAYRGEDSGDFGRYYVAPGRWCYVAAVIPEAPPPGDSSWRSVARSSAG